MPAHAETSAKLALAKWRCACWRLGRARPIGKIWELAIGYFRRWLYSRKAIQHQYDHGTLTSPISSYQLQRQRQRRVQAPFWNMTWQIFLKGSDIWPPRDVISRDKINRTLRKSRLLALWNKGPPRVTTVTLQEAQLMLTTGSTRLAVSRGQQTWYHSTCYIWFPIVQ